MESYGEHTRKATLQELAEGLFVDKEIDYVKIKDKEVASLGEIDVTGESSIFVKLTKYPYEFEIGSDLHLASVDGVKVETGDETVTISKEEYENMKPNPITADSLLLTAVNFSTAIETVNLSSFNLTFGNTFENYFSLDKNTGELTCKKSGWYCINSELYMNSGDLAFSWLKFFLNEIEFSKLNGVVSIGSNLSCNNNSVTIFLSDKDKISFSKITTQRALTADYNATIQIYKL